jgi:hypothetical protein
MITSSDPHVPTFSWKSQLATSFQGCHLTKIILKDAKKTSSNMA